LGQGNSSHFVRILKEPMSIRVLIVEDDAAIADFLIRGLNEEGYAVAHAADGDEGRRRLETESWDVVLLDCWLPRMDGLTVLRHFRQQGGVSPVLLLTARDAVADRVRGLDSGADDYLCKPFAFAELLARIRSLSRRQDHRGSTLITYGEIKVDLASQRAERNGKRLDLTVKEQSLLTFFLRNAGKVLSRSRIYEHVWDEQYDGVSNTLEVHVMELRRKLEAHGPRLIFTLRGRGYVLSEKPQAEWEQA
jgi:two-component system copper resistance phosphate regulon response regulator CusR